MGSPVSASFTVPEMMPSCEKADEQSPPKPRIRVMMRAEKRFCMIKLFENDTTHTRTVQNYRWDVTCM
jgi:hypothetical protein